MKVIGSYPEVVEAYKGFKAFTRDEDLRELAEKRELWQMEYNTDIKRAMQQGIEQGSYRKALFTARNMLNDRLPAETIAKYTGLSTEEIGKLNSEK